jgi:LEA14-like dessication related protein
VHVTVVAAQTEVDVDQVQLADEQSVDVVNSPQTHEVLAVRLAETVAKARAKNSI